MRSFRPRRQSSQWGLDEDDDPWSMDPSSSGSRGESALLISSGTGHSSSLRGGESTTNITLPGVEDHELSGGRLENKEAVYNMRKKWISDRLIERENEFCRYPSINVFCGTFNVAGRKHEGEDLSPWLGRSSVDPDIYAVGFQEIVDLNAVNVAVSDTKSQQRVLIWRQELERFLHTRKSPYRLVEQRSLVGIALFVYVQERHDARQIQDVQTTIARVGVMGMGNKGAVVVRLSFYDSTLCFVCAHMAPKRANVVGRNADFWSILGKTAFAGDPETAWEFRGLPCEFSRGRVEGAVGILDHDVVFWLGDLNYRVSEMVRLDDVFRRCRTSQGQEYLIAHDQLNLERNRGPGAAFSEFDEAPIAFAPTYKYQPGTQVFEQRPDKKLRAPAWCDRVLWRSRDPGHVKPLDYSMTAALMMSDHKPVSAELSVKIRQIERQKRLRSFEAVANQIRHVELRGLQPELSLGCSSLELGDVYYRREAAAVLRVANVGQGLAFLRFTPKMDEILPFRRWLKVDPAFALLTPGDRVEFRVSIRVDRRTAREVCAGFEVLEETLVLRLEGGAEHYVPVTARYASPSFGTPLSLLSDKVGSEAARLGIPPQLWRLVDGMVQRGVLQNAEMASDVFPPIETSVPPDAPLDFDTDTVLRCIDTDSEFPHTLPGSAFAFGLLAFLSGLPEPVIPLSAVAAVESALAARRVDGAWETDGEADGAWTVAFLRALSPARHNTFLYIVVFLREVAVVGRAAGLRPGNLASYVCDALFFQDTPWIGTSLGGIDAGTPIEASMWKKHRDVFRDMLNSFISASR